MSPRLPEPPSVSTTLWTIVRLDLRRLARERTSIISVIAALAGGATAGVWMDRADPAMVDYPLSFDLDTDDKKDDSDGPLAVALCVPSDTPRVSLRGPIPTELRFPGTLLGPDDPTADLVVEAIDAERPRIRTWVAAGADPKAVNTRIDKEHDALASCIRRWRREQSDRLLEDLGIRERFGKVVYTRTPSVVAPLDLSFPREAWQYGDRLALLIAMLGSIMTFSVLLDTVPRTRQSGWEETLAALGVSPGRMSLALWIMAVLAGLAVQLSMVVGHALAAPFLGWHLTSMGLLGAVFLAPQVAAFVHLAIAAATDLAGAAFRSVGPLIVLSYSPLTLGAVLPAWAAILAPSGSVVAVSLAGSPDLTLHHHLLSAVASLGWTAALVMLAARRFESRLHGAVHSDPSAARHARGQFGREALLLLFIGIWAFFMLPSMLAVSPTASFLFGQFVGLAATCLLVVYALPVRLGHVLSLRRPRVRGMLTGLATPPLTLNLMHAILWGTVLLWPSFGEQLAQSSTTDAIVDLAGPLGGALVWAVPPLCEELFFRGALLGLLLGGGRVKPTRARAFTAVALQAAAFGFIHAPAIRVLPSASLGLVLGLLVLRTRSIWPAILLHMVHNALALHAGDFLVDAEWWMLAPAGLLAFPLVYWGAGSPEDR